VLAVMVHAKADATDCDPRELAADAAVAFLEQAMDALESGVE